jgi:hypothetical protein
LIMPTVSIHQKEGNLEVIRILKVTITTSTSRDLNANQASTVGLDNFANMLYYNIVKQSHESLDGTSRV